MKSRKVWLQGLMFLVLLSKTAQGIYASLSVDQWQNMNSVPNKQGLSMMDLSFYQLEQDARDVFFTSLSPESREWNFYCLSKPAKVRHFLTLSEDPDEANEDHLNARDKNFRYLPWRGKVAFWGMLSKNGRKLNFKLLPPDVMAENFHQLSDELDSEGFNAKDFNFRFLPQPFRDESYDLLSPNGQSRDFCWLSENTRVEQFPHLSDEPNVMGWTSKDSNFIHIPQNLWDHFFNLLSLQGQNAYFRKLSEGKRIEQWSNLSNVPSADGLTSQERHFKHLPTAERGKVFHLLRPVAQNMYFDLLSNRDKLSQWSRLDTRGKDRNFCNLPPKAQTMKRLRQLSQPYRQLYYNKVFFSGL